jgi:hypothetical protein
MSTIVPEEKMIKEEIMKEDELDQSQITFIYSNTKLVKDLPDISVRFSAIISRDASRAESHDPRCLFIAPYRRIISYESRFWYFEEVIAQIKIQKIQREPICVDNGNSLCIMPRVCNYAPVETRVISFMIARLIMQQFNLIMTSPVWCKFDNIPQRDNVTQRSIISSSCDEDTLHILGAESLSSERITFIDKYVQGLYPKIACLLGSQIDSMPTVIMQRNDCGIYTRHAMVEDDADLTPFRNGKFACVPIIIMAKMVYCTYAGSNKYQWAPIVIIGNTIIVWFNLDEMTVSCINNFALIRAAYFGNTCIKYVFAIDYGSNRYGVYVTRFTI